MAQQSPLSLAEVLARQDVWRGDRLASARPGLATGYPELDALLPGGGWPRDALVEILSEGAGFGELSCLLPALARQSGRLWLVAPPHLPYGPGLASQGIAPERVVCLWLAGRDRDKEALWACEQIIAARLAGGACLAWLPRATPAALRRLQAHLEDGGGPLFVYRPLLAAGDASPAPLRIRLEPGGSNGEAGGLQVHILKRRGLPCHQTLSLPVAGWASLPRLHSTPSLSPVPRVVAGHSLSPSAPGSPGDQSPGRSGDPPFAIQFAEA